ncbi:MAG: prepilin-type N-terminal cleavage/methylation domain-containing protein [Thermodesulfobacteriota bacterium]
MAKAKTPTSTAGNWNRRPRGFALLELLIVLVLVGMFFVAGLPGFRQELFTDPLQRTALHLAGLLEQIRQTAIREHREIRLQVRAGREFRWTGGGDGESSPVQGAEAERSYRLPDGVAVAAILCGRERLDPGLSELRFSRKGYVASSVVYLRDSGGRILSLVLSPFVAEVLVREGRAGLPADGAG